MIASLAAISLAAAPLGPARAPVAAWLVAGWDPGFVVKAGAARRLGGTASDAWLELAVPPVLVPRGAGKLQAGVRAWLGADGWRAGGPGVELSSGTGLALARDPTGTKLAWTLEASTRPGWSGARGGAAIDVGWRGAIATYVRPSRAVRDLYGDRPAGALAGPREGWYRLPAARLRLGLAAAWRPGGAAALFGAGGLDRSGQAPGLAANPSLGALPLWAEGGVTHAW